MAAPKEENPILVAFTLDFETGGLKCQTSACTQIAIHATRLDTFERLGSYVKYIYPYSQKEIKGVTAKRKVLKNKHEVEDEKPMDYEAKALEYSAITMDMLYNMGVDIVTVANEVVQFIADHTPKTPKNMKPFLIGQNVDFDKGFFMQMMEYADFYGHWQPDVLDTIILGQLAMCATPNTSSYKLELMCERLGVELDDAHDADADVSATTNVVAVLTQRMRSIGGTIEGGEISMTKTEKSRKHFKI